LILGCRVNFAESYEWQKLSIDLGFEIVKTNKKFDICIVNTCTVTDNADRKSNKSIINLIKKNPNSEIWITGCGINSPEIKLVKENTKIKYIKRENIKIELEKLIKNKKEKYENKETYDLKTRAFLKIQDGCNNFCSYCIIPHTRGREKSLPEKLIINKINELLKEGFKEIVLTGIHLSNWGSEDNFKNGELSYLLKSILNNTDIKRLRFGSLEPRFFNEDFINILNDKRVCPHLHLSLQSGSDKILKLMKRHYTKKEYKEMVDNLFKNVENFSLTTDLIVGFPGETEDLFNETIDFIKKIPFSKLHVFPYSKRINTLAYNMPNQISSKVKKERSLILREISDNKQKIFIEKNLNQIYPILIEHKKGEYFSGLSPNYIRVWFKSNEKLNNQILNIKIQKPTEMKNMIGAIGKVENQ
jgi:threonylcarbamoyladenosine tRNA methylthiotransferase MtaB